MSLFFVVLVAHFELYHFLHYQFVHIINYLFHKKTNIINIKFII